MIALAAVIEVNGSAQINDELRSVAETIIALASERTLTGNSLRYHRKMCLRLGLGAQIKSAYQGKKDAAARKPAFDLLPDQPGEHSKHGPRHDNDFQDIVDIQILPTMNEILSDRAEYLPRTEPSSWHLPGIEGLLDRQFCLIREDTVGQLRDAAKVELERMRNPHQPRSTRNAGPRTHSYRNVRLVDAELDHHKGLLCVLQFDQPWELRGMTPAQRREWWEESNRLGSDALIVLLASDNKIACFLTVAAAEPPLPPGVKRKSQQPPIEKRFPRVGKNGVSQVVVQLVNNGETDIENMLIRFGMRYGKEMSDPNLSFTLLEFPGVLLPAFHHTLNALQQMSVSQDLPFANLLAPTGEPDNDAQIEVPAYARKQGFYFDLSILSPKNENIRLDPTSRLDPKELSAKTPLDNAQSEALISSLSRSIALIQGPPGTGKSYTGIALTKVLLANKETARLGPILCVTFTNHALDQILEHLVSAGVKQVIRIGSRSKSELLTDLNLRVVAKQEDLTKVEKRSRWEFKKSVDNSAKLVNHCLARLGAADSDGLVMSFLEEEYPGFHAQLSGPEIDEDGFQMVESKQAPNGLRSWLDGNTRGSPKQGLFSHEPAGRWRLYTGWKEEMMDSIQRSLLANMDEYKEAKAKLNQIRTEVDLRVLTAANVIGVTTSGLARQLDTLRRLNCKVLLVEEAGEVLEAHLLTAMLPSVEHVILIGDHQQLRPKAQNYELSCDNPRSEIKLDVSLFERLVHPPDNTNRAVPWVTLEIQRRMHPSISELIRSTLYPNLQDAPSVSQYPEVSGMRRRLFWLDHEQAEDGQDESESTSHVNSYEVDMVFALVRHLVRQGVYRATDIAVLTPYLGQLRKLRRALSSFAEVIVNDRDIDDLAAQGDDEEDAESIPKPKEEGQQPPRLGVQKSTLLQALRLATVDNFQGEEAKVVIVSLVRCNKELKCGFLGTSNRINVLLSRAQHGMYILGNTDTSGHIPMWSDVLAMLRKNGNVGTHLELCCPRHPDTPLEITTPDDFSRVSPEAGCDLLCGDRLPCGHSCINKCHSEGLHKAVYCTKPCTRTKPGCDHNCQYECGRACDKNCLVIIRDIDVELPCGHHVTKLPCYQYQNPALVKCKVPVERTVPGCGHKVTKACHIDVNHVSYTCKADCGAVLPCGHICRDWCVRCRPRGNDNEILEEKHSPCKQPCGRNYTSCKHSCDAPCHAGKSECPLCEEPCDVQCSHARCKKKCHEPCTPCAEEACASCCPHSKCSMPCAAPCDWVPCSKRCERLLTCGHQCPSICGTTCPSERYCQICAPDDIKDLRADIIMFETYGNVDLSESPCLILPCGHVFTVESLDGVMAMSDHFQLDGNGMPSAIKENLEPFSQKEAGLCPDCRGSLRLLPRYGRMVRRALLDESTKKFVTWSNQEYLNYAEQMKALQGKLIETRESATLPPSDAFLGEGSHVEALQKLHRNRYRNLATLRRGIGQYLDKTTAEEQPFKRVQDIVEAMRRRHLHDEQNIEAFDFDPTILQTRGSLLGSALAIRCEIVGLTDFIAVSTLQQEGRSLRLDTSLDREACGALIEAAKKAINPLQQTEGHIFWAQLAGLECEVMEGLGSATSESFEHFKRLANAHLDSAKELCTEFPSQTASVVDEIDDVRRSLREAGYQSQMRMVVAALEKAGGRWYRCQNGHPFTVGECGMPMEIARCSQCNAPIGGSHHQAVQGVQQANDIEREFGTLRIAD